MRKILAISGSTRKGSSNNMILRHIANQFKGKLDFELFDSIDQLPHFNPDLANNPPEQVVGFQEKLKQADGVLICTPEYVFSMPGSLKNAIEWNVSTTIFSNKPVALIVAAASGEKAFESLDLIMTTIESKIAPDSKLLIKGIKGKINHDGILEKETASKVDQIVLALLNAI